MDFLALCQALRRESGIQGAGPTSVVDQSGMYEKIVGWVQQSYREILREQDWTFAWARGTTTLETGVAEYAALADIDDLGRVYRRKVRDLTSAGQPYLVYIDFDRFDRLTASSGQPRYFTRRPDDQLAFWPTPDADYSLQLDYQREGSTLEAGDDEPIIPDESLRMVIVWHALLKYGLHDEDQAAVANAQTQRAYLKNQMCQRYLPKLSTRQVPLDQVEVDLPELV